jgi:hypothetical protein
VSLRRSARGPGGGRLAGRDRSRPLGCRSGRQGLPKVYPSGRPSSLRSASDWWRAARSSRSRSKSSTYSSSPSARSDSRRLFTKPPGTSRSGKIGPSSRTVYSFAACRARRPVRPKSQHGPGSRKSRGVHRPPSDDWRPPRLHPGIGWRGAHVGYAPLRSRSEVSLRQRFSRSVVYCDPDGIDASACPGAAALRSPSIRPFSGSHGAGALSPVGSRCSLSRAIRLFDEQDVWTSAPGQRPQRGDVDGDLAVATVNNMRNPGSTGH